MNSCHSALFNLRLELQISFFPSVWTEEEHENWGKQWVDHVLNIK